MIKLLLAGLLLLNFNNLQAQIIEGAPGASSAGGGSGTVTSVASGCGLSGSVTTAGTIVASMAINAQTGTTYTVLNGDCGKLVSIGNASAVAITLPQANGSTFIAGWYAYIQNTGAGAVTITPTTSTIDGAATLILSQNQGALIASDGTNYKTYRGMYPTFALNAVLKGGGVGAALIGSGVTIDASNQITAPGGFSTGGSPGGPLVMSGSTSGTTTIVSPAVAGTPTLIWPTQSGTFINENSAASTLPAHASRHQNGGSDEVATATPGASVIPKTGSDSRLVSGFIPWVASATGLSLTNGTPGVIVSSNTPAAQTDIYTSPALTRTLVGDCLTYNPTGVTSTLTYFFKSLSAVYWRFGGVTAVTTNSTGNAKNFNFILEPGESFAVTPTAVGVNIWCKTAKFSSSDPYYTARIFNPATGQNTLYTVPANKIGAPLAGSTSSGTLSAGSVTVINDSGGSRTYTTYVVLSGGSPGTTNQISTGVAVGTGSSSVVPTIAGFPNMSAGDFISLNVDAGTATQWAYVTVMER